MNKTFIASSELVSFYKENIDITGCKNIEDIIDIFKLLLISNLSKLNLVYLKEEALKADWHIHTHTFEEIKKLNDDIYICHGCLKI